MFGANDAQAAKKDGTWHKVGTEAWREVYGKRVEDFIKQLRAAKIATYWVGLPIMRSPGQAADAEVLNEVFREKAFINGAKFVDVWNGFADEGGRFSPYGPDLDGQARRMRADDGMHFTMRGNVKLAHYVEKDLRKDLNAAKQERNVPLAGTEEEQAKLAGGASAPEDRSTRAGNAGHAVTEPTCAGRGRRGGRGERAGGGSAHAGNASAGDPGRGRERAAARDLGLLAQGRGAERVGRGGLGHAGRRNDHQRASRWLDRRCDPVGDHRCVADFVTAAAPAVAAPLLPGAHQGRAAQAEIRPRRRLRLAAGLGPVIPAKAGIQNRDLRASGAGFRLAPE